MNALEMNVEERESYISFLGMYADNNTAIWGQYERMVDFVYEHFPSTNQRFDAVAAPLLHTIAHGSKSFP